MKKYVLFIYLGVITMFFASCEKDLPQLEEEQEESGERITFLKSASYSLNDDQDPFLMMYAHVNNDTTVNFIMEYKIGEKYNLHKFDFVWDGKFTEDNEGKKWMNITMYHITKEENRTQTVSDSAYVFIPDLMKIAEADRDKAWLRLLNSTDESNVIEIKYVAEDETGDDDFGGDDDTPVDSSSVSSIAIMSNYTR